MDEPLPETPHSGSSRVMIDAGRFALAVNLLLAGMAVIVLDLRLEAFDVLLDPAGQALVLAGLVVVARITPRTPLTAPTLALGWVALGVSVALEAAVLTGEAAVGTVSLSSGGTLLGTSLLVAQGLGIVAFAQHLRRVLDGVASDRWRQVTIAWAVALGLLPLLAITRDLLLLLVVGAVVIVAGVLLLLSLLATRAYLREPGAALGD